MSKVRSGGRGSGTRSHPSRRMLRCFAHLAACAVVAMSSASAASSFAAPVLRGDGRCGLRAASENRQASAAIEVHDDGEAMYERSIIHRLNDSKEGKSAAPIDDHFDKARSIYERLELVLNDGDDGNGGDTYGDPDACTPHGGDDGKKEA